MKEGDICLKCGEGILRKPRVAYRVFEGRKHPDFVCDHCGAFHWEHPDPTIPLPTLKTTEQRKERKPEKKEREPTFEELLKRDEKKREKRRRYRRNRRRRKLIEAEKSRT